ncbi:MAG: cupin domain-containing protein [Pseudomonadales bacterium]
MDAAARNGNRSSQGRRWRRRIGWGAVILILGYLGLGNLLHLLVFPLPPPDPETFPRAGDVLSSEIEGFEQRVLAVEDGWIVSELRLVPGAGGPPQHYHREFVEVFPVVQGTLHVELEDRIVEVPAGEVLRIEAGVAHRPFNPTAEPVLVAGGAKAIPVTFAACLVQMYSMMEETGNGPRMLLQLAVNDPICDTHLAAVPKWSESLLRVGLGPLARMAGYRNYYPERALHAPAT